MINKQLLTKSAAQYGLVIDENTADKFDAFAENLVETNKHLNLTSITAPDDIVIKHFIDSLLIFKHVDIPTGAKVIDVGCGGGFPSLPMLIFRPDLEMTFFDSLLKRLRFIEGAVAKLSLVGDILHGRAEEMSRTKEYREEFDFAVSRAVAPLNVLLEYCLPYVKVGGCFVALKGSQDELPQSLNAVKKLGGEVVDNVYDKLPSGDERHIVIVKKISQTPTQYPRRSKKITDSPL